MVVLSMFIILVLMTPRFSYTFCVTLRTSSSSHLRRQRMTSNLNAKKNQQNQENQRKRNPLPPRGGIYSRPATAISRGGGFFVPGLTSPPSRLLASSALLGTCVWLALRDKGEFGVGEASSVAAAGILAAKAALELARDVVEGRREMDGEGGMLMQNFSATTFTQYAAEVVLGITSFEDLVVVDVDGGVVLASGMVIAGGGDGDGEDGVEPPGGGEGGGSMSGMRRTFVKEVINGDASSEEIMRDALSILSSVSSSSSSPPSPSSPSSSSSSPSLPENVRIIPNKDETLVVILGSSKAMEVEKDMGWVRWFFEACTV